MGQSNLQIGLGKIVEATSAHSFHSLVTPCGLDPVASGCIEALCKETGGFRESDHSSPCASQHRLVRGNESASSDSNQRDDDRGLCIFQIAKPARALRPGAHQSL